MLYVDASWKNKKELAGVGWSLHCREGTQHIQGSSSIQATNSSLEAEAQALSMAVQQMRRLAYQNIIFMTDSRLLVDELNQFNTGSNICDSP